MSSAAPVPTAAPVEGGRPPFAPPDGRRLSWPWAIVVPSGVVLAALWLWRFAPGLDADLAARAITHGMLPLALLLGVVFGFAPSGPEQGSGVRRGWRLLGAGALAWWLAGVIWELTGRQALSWADPMHLLIFPLTLAALRAFPGRPMSTVVRLRFSLDVSVVMMSGLAGVWYFAVWPFLSHGTDDFSAVAINTVYAVGDLVLLLAVCAALVRSTDRGSRAPLTWVAIALLGRFLGDLAFGWETARGGYAAGGPTDLFWLTAFWLFAMGAAAQHAAPRRSGAVAAEPVEGPHEAPPLAHGVLPYASVAIVYSFLVVIAGPELGERALGVLWSAVGVTALVLVRQFVAIRENTRLLAERAARASETRFRTLVQNSSDVIVVVDESGEILYASPSLTRVLGHDAATVVGQSLARYVEGEGAAQTAGTLARVAQRTGTTRPILLRALDASGECRQMEAVATNLLHDATVGGIVITARDVTERAALEAQLVHQAFHDPLTGLANRALLRDRVEHALTRGARRAERCALLFLDLDDFKRVNDSMGHAAGDRLLTVVASRLLHATRGADTVARLGGDEFAVLLSDVRTEAEAVIVAERVVRALAAPISVDATEVSVAASIGIAIAEPEDGADELLRNADVAMYRAKQGGKGGHELFAPEMHAALLDRLELEADLRHALADERCADFRLLYQPIVRLDGTGVTGVEALVRWQHPRRGLVSPLTFIPIAEVTGLILPLGRWVLREACRQGALWQAARGHGEPPLTLTVNISGRQLQYPGLVAEVAAALADSGLPASCLVLEITESVIMQDTAPTLAMLHALKALGIRLAIDDFGTGYSSLSYLQRFPIDILKIDKTFVDGVARGGSDAALARTIVALGNMLALRCVAEGIEDDSQREHLQEIGCELGQGYLFARPLTAEAAEALMANGTGELVTRA